MARFCLAALALCLALPGAGRAAAAPAFYVSPLGSDANDGVSAQTPFLTLERARDAMRASATVKTVYLLGGVYRRRDTLRLRSNDAGESWLGYPGQTPVLDGGGATGTALFIAADDVAVRGITIQDFSENGILAKNAAGAVIDGNTVFNTISTAWSQGAISALHSFTRGRITHNLVRGARYCGISLDTQPGDDISGVVIGGNEVYDACSGMKDCGGIYANDRGHHSVGVVISGNIVGARGALARGSKGLYLDDELSNAQVHGNVVFGNWRWALEVHGGDHDVIRGNVFDISGAGALALYEKDSPRRDYGMAGNVFQCNVVYSTAPPPAELFQAWPKTKPRVLDNLYWDPRGALPTGGAVADASPIVADPGFDPGSSTGYAIKPGLLPASCGAVGILSGEAGPAEK